MTGLLPWFSRPSSQNQSSLLISGLSEDTCGLALSLPMFSLVAEGRWPHPMVPWHRIIPYPFSWSSTIIKPLTFS